jgi:flagellar motor switch protein FliN
MTKDGVLDRFVAELTRAVGRFLDANVSHRAPSPSVAIEADGFVATFTATAGDHGTLTAYFGRAGAAPLAGGAAAAAGDAHLVDPLRSICEQIAASLDRRSIGHEIALQSVEPFADAPDLPGVRLVELVIVGNEQPLQVVLVSDLEFVETADGRKAASSKTLDVIMDIDLPLIVRFGRTELPLKKLTALGPGSVIDLERSPDEPVEILISNRVVARGEVVIVSGNYGVRVREVISPVERARSLEERFS